MGSERAFAESQVVVRFGPFACRRAVRVRNIANVNICALVPFELDAAFVKMGSESSFAAPITNGRYAARSRVRMS